MDLTGKVALITGGSSGIGAATAKLFASHGANVAIIGRHEARLLAVGMACEAAKGNQMLVLKFDLTVEGNCEEAIRQTVQTFKKIDILVNCAGKAGMSSLFDNSTEIFDELMALNLRVPYKMTQLCAPHLKDTKGNIVNVFGAPLRVRPGFLPFAMIRDALERFTKAGAVELAAEGIRMNAVRLGITRTNFLTNLNVDDEHMDIAYDRLADLVPNNVFGT
ncbi:Short-chain dehydrogenase [Operophtera brumata]|uniref:Short-chain dehydrogenase n=1 Tax=Operophtera brumata TaxID=104452 RepID=A0A0L7LUE8_OPEBR|nr:Short-chain dehydrogenase [Operophtera brumata]